MDLGRDVCKPKKPLCEICPISYQCEAYSINATHLYPIPKQKNKKLPHYIIGVGVIWNNNKILITCSCKLKDLQFHDQLHHN